LACWIIFRRNFQCFDEGETLIIRMVTDHPLCEGTHILILENI
jgi:hypothetical protein